MGDERERMSQDIEGLRKRLLVVNERWEVVCADLKAENARLQADIETCLEANLEMGSGLESQHNEIVALRGALQALVDAAGRVYESYDSEERGFVMWQLFVEMDAARAGAVRLLLPEGP